MRTERIRGTREGSLSSWPPVMLHYIYQTFEPNKFQFAIFACGSTCAKRVSIKSLTQINIRAIVWEGRKINDQYNQFNVFLRLAQLHLCHVCRWLTWSCRILSLLGEKQIAFVNRRSVLFRVLVKSNHSYWHYVVHMTCTIFMNVRVTWSPNRLDSSIIFYVSWSTLLLLTNGFVFHSAYLELQAVHLIIPPSFKLGRHSIRNPVCWSSFLFIAHSFAQELVCALVRRFQLRGRLGDCICNLAASSILYNTVLRQTRNPSILNFFSLRLPFQFSA